MDKLAKFAKQHTPTLTLAAFVLAGLSYYFVTIAKAEATYAHKDDVTEIKATLRQMNDNVIAICTVTPTAKCNR